MCPYSLLCWSRQYQTGDAFDASVHFGLWVGCAVLRWIGADGRYYCDLYLDQDDPNRKTGAGSFTRHEIEKSFELFGGPTCRAEMADPNARPFWR